MAINYTVQNVTDAGAVVLNNMPNVQNAIRDAILLNPAWSLVQEMDSGTFHWVVLKCSASGSGLPADFYVAVLRTLTTGRIYHALFEQYTAGTPGTIGRYAPRYDFTPSGVDTVYGYLNSTLSTATVTTSSLGMSGTSTNYNSITPSATVTLRIIVNPSHIVIWSDKMEQYVFPIYIGALDSVVPNASVADPMPLVASHGYLTVCTRVPLPSSASPGVSSFYLEHHMVNPGIQFPPMPDTSITVYDKYNGGPSAVRLIASMNPTYRATNGYFRGMWKSVRQTASIPAGTLAGDTLTISGTKWVYLGTDRCWFDTGTV